MGTLFHQSNRNYLRVSLQDIENEIKELQRIASEQRCSLSDVIALKNAMERDRFNTMYVQNGDVWDEQIAGIGELIQRIADTLERIHLYGLMVESNND